MVGSFLSRMILGIVVAGGLGWLLAGPNGGLFGILLGFVFVFLYPLFGSAARGVREGDVVHSETQHVRCYPRGLEADCEFVRDDRGHWLDVEKCSLMPEGGEPTCEKRCLILMNDMATT